MLVPSALCLGPQTLQWIYLLLQRHHWVGGIGDVLGWFRMHADFLRTHPTHFHVIRWKNVQIWITGDAQHRRGSVHNVWRPLELRFCLNLLTSPDASTDGGVESSDDETMYTPLSPVLILDEKFMDHIHEKSKYNYTILGIIKINFKHLNIQYFIPLYKSMVNRF